MLADFLPNVSPFKVFILLFQKQQLDLSVAPVCSTEHIIFCFFSIFAQNVRQGEYISYANSETREMLLYFGAGK